MSDQLYAGASRVCITPGPEYFPIEHFNNHMTGKPSIFSGKVAEDVFVRTIILKNSETKLVWVTLDMPGVPEAKEVRSLIAALAGVADTNVFYTCTHDHSNIYADNPIFEKFYGEPFSTKVRTYRKWLREEILPRAVREAEESLQPARVGVERGECYLNVNRNEKELGPKAGTYGFRVGGPTDRDLYLLRVETPEGTPIAILYNFAVHACMMIHNNPEGKGTEISGDFVGHACRIIEKSYEDKVTVMFTSGAAGDMNPIMMSRVNIVEPDGKITTRDLGAAGPIIWEFMGNRLARDVVNTNAAVVCRNPAPSLWAGTRYFQLASSIIGMPGPDRPVDFRIGMMAVGDTAIIITNGEVFNQIGRRLKDATPFRKTMMITHAGQWVGYIKDDSGEGAYEQKALQAVRELVDEYLAR